MMQLRSSCLGMLVLLLGPAIRAPVSAATPHEELLRRTPSDVSFVVVVRDLREHFAAVADGPLAKQFRESKLGQTLAATPEVKQIDTAAKQLSMQLGVEWTRIRDDIFGDAVLLAYKNGPPGKPQEDSGLMLTWAREPKLVRELLERIDKAQKSSGELKELQELSHGGQTYFRRIKNKGPDDYWFLAGSILAFSQQENLIRRVIDLGAATPVSVQKDSALTKRFEELKSPGCFALLWVNPRSFDAELDEKLKQAKGGEEAFLKSFRTCWKAVDGIGATLRLDKHLEVRLSLDARLGALPPGLRRFAQTLGEPSPLWGFFPADPMFAATSCLDPAAILDALSEFMAPEARQALKASLEQSLGMAFGKNVLPLLPQYLGPDIGICVSAPSAGAKSPVPEVLAAIRIRPGKEQARLEQSILDAIDVLTTLIRVGFNAQHPEPIRVRTVRQGEVEIKYLTHDSFPPGFQPAYALKGGFLLVASSPDVIRQAQPAEPREKAVNRSLYVSFRQFDRFLKNHAEAVVNVMTVKNEATKDEATHQLDNLHMVFELLDRLELINDSPAAGRGQLTLRLHFASPLRK